MVFYEIKPSALTVYEYSGSTQKDYILEINIALEEGEDITVAMYSNEIDTLQYKRNLYFDFGLRAGEPATKIIYENTNPYVAYPFNLLIRASRVGGIDHYRIYISQKVLAE